MCYISIALVSLASISIMLLILLIDSVVVVQNLSLSRHVRHTDRLEIVLIDVNLLIVLCRRKEDNRNKARDQLLAQSSNRHSLSPSTTSINSCLSTFSPGH